MAEDVYTRILAHVAALSKNPETPQEIRLFEEAQMVLPSYLQSSKPLVDKRLLLMRHLASDLQDHRRLDHNASVELLIKLFDGWTWAQVCDFGTASIPYKDGLSVGSEAGEMVPFNRLMLCLLGKAAEGNTSDAAHAASMLETMQALVRLWLMTHDTGVATRAEEVLTSLLRVDRPQRDLEGSWRSGGGQGQGLVWKRIFGDRDVYRVFYEVCSWEGLKLGKSQKTIAQARLLQWLPKIGAMSWTALSQGHHRDIEASFGIEGGLLDFAALKMVDYREDVLMHQVLIDFFAEILDATKTEVPAVGTQHASVGLEYMIKHGLHVRTSAIYLQLPGTPVDPVEAMFLYGPAANYLSKYATNYPDHFMASQMLPQVLNRLTTTLDLSPARWAHSDSPKHDLHLLTSLPRRALLPSTGSFSSSPVALLPSKATNEDVLQALAYIFHGPEELSPEHAPLEPGQEGAAARQLYYHYLSSNPRLWQDVTGHADTIALKDVAMAAIICLHMVITAQWPLDQEAADVPTNIATPASGHLAILTPPALEYTLPYLLRPAQSFANLVGGRGDTESSAYKVAMAKFGALKALKDRLVKQVEQTPGEGYEEILATVAKKVAEGPMSRDAEVGGRVGTLEL